MFIIESFRDTEVEEIDTDHYRVYNLKGIQTTNYKQVIVLEKTGPPVQVTISKFKVAPNCL